MDTARGSLSYHSTDLVVEDAGKTISAARTYRSSETAVGDAGPGWSTSFSEGLSTSQGLSSLKLSDGRSLPFATDPAVGYAPAPGVAADYTAGPTGAAITAADQTTYEFDPAGDLTGVLLGDSGHRVAVTRSGGKLVRVTGASGRFVDYARTNGRLTSLTDSQGRGVAMSYSSGRLASVSGVDGETELYDYDTQGRLTKVTAPSGDVRLAAGYDGAGRVAWAEESGVGRSTFAYDTANRRTTITRADGVQVVQVYDRHGRLVVEQVVGGSAQHVMYDASGHEVVRIGGIPTKPSVGYQPVARGALVDARGDVVVQVDAESRVVLTTFNTAHRPLTTTYSDGGVVTRTYNAQGRVATVTDQLGKTWSYTYNGRGQVLTRVNPLAETRTLTYESDGDLNSVTDETGAVTRYEYDALGRPLVRVDPAGNRFATTYTTWGAPLVTTLPSGDSSGREYDEDRRLSATADGNGSRTRYEYDTLGRLATTVDPLDHLTTAGYDPVGRITTVTDVRGSVSHLTYSADGAVTSSTDPSGATTTFTNDPAGRPMRVTNTIGQVTQTTYAGTGQATLVQRPNGAVEKYTLDPVGRVATFTSGEGGVWKSTYDLAGHLAVVTDPLNYTRAFGYDALGRTTSVTNKLDQVTQLSYNDTARTVTATDTLGTLAITTYDARGQLVAETDGSGAVTRYEYNADGLRQAVVDQTGERTTFEYDDAGRLVATTDPLGRRTSSTLDALGHVLAVTDAANHTTTSTYEPGGLVATVTDRTGRVWEKDYDARGLLTTTTDPAGKQTHLTYDQLGRQTKSVDATGVETNTAYDPVGQAAVIWDATGASWVNSYDLDGNLTRVVDPVGLNWSYGYNKRGERTSVDREKTLISSRRWSYTYDKIGNLATSKRPLGVAESYQYDQRGRQTVYTNEEAANTTSAYDGAGRVTSVTSPGGHTSSRTYDPAGRVLTSVDALGNTSHQVYDGAGQLMTLTLPMGGSYSYTYTALGDVATEIDPNGNVTTFSYDDDGRPTRTATPAGRFIDSRYDSVGRQWQTQAGATIRETGYDDAGRVTSTKVGGQPDTAFTYNERGLVASSTNRWGTTSYVYDNARRLTTLIPPSGPATAYTYVAGGISATEGPGLVATVRGPMSVNYVYNKEGSVLERRYTGRIDTYQYGAFGREISRTEAASAATTLTYGPDGQLATTIEPVTGSPDPRVTTNGYDNAGRLTSQTVIQGSTTLSNQTYGWDADGNRTSVTSGAGTPITYTYDSAGRLQGNSEGITYSYDADGNQTTATGPTQSTTLSYNAFGELDGVQTAAGGAISYTRDALGRTNARTSGTSTQYFAYRGSTNTLTATSVGNGPTTTLINGQRGETLGMTTTGGSTLRPVTNAHTDVTKWQDNATGAVTSTTNYDPFGAIGAPSGTLPPINLGFQGSLTDSATGMVDMGFRSYDPATARFISADNVTGAYGAPVELNRYRYGNADPINYIDPDGHWPQWLDNAVDWVGDLFQRGTGAAGDKFDNTTTTLAGWGNSAKDWAKANKAGIAEFAVGVVVYAGCEFAIGAGSGGVGAIAGAAACGALAGELGALAGQAVRCSDHTTESGCDPVEFANAVIVGGITGAVGGGVGAGIGRALGNSIARNSGGNALSRMLGGAFKGGVSGAVGGGLTGGVTGAVGYQATCGEECTSDGLIAAARGGAMFGAAFGTIGGAFGGGRAARSCATHSFDPDTEVLLADGSTKPIKDVTISDKVTATDPETGTTSAQPVTELHLNRDTDLTDVTVSATPAFAAGTATTLHTTQHHPFWDNTAGAWANAEDLVVGHELLARDGTSRYVVAIRSYTGAADMRDLTVANVHTYYVIAGDQPVLVHNCGGSVGGHQTSCTCGGGGIDPKLVRFSQDEVSAAFSNGNTIEQTAAGLRSGYIDPGSIPTVRLFAREGNLFTLDNRRLVAFQKAGITMPFRMATPEEIAAESWKLTTKNNGISVLINKVIPEVWRP